MSLPLSLDKKDGAHILKVLGYACASAVISAIISLLASSQIAPEYMALVPIVNTLLVAGKKYLDNSDVQE